MWLASAAGLLLAAPRPIWVHGSLAEVYSLSLAIGVAIVWVTLDLKEEWSDRKAFALALLGGLGVAHHRLLAVLLPVIGLYLLAPLWKRLKRGGWRWLAGSIGLFLAGFLPYVDMPLRVWRGATWVYGRPDTWDGFWFLFLGTEYQDWQKPDFNLPAVAAAAGDVARFLSAELTLPGLAVIGAASIAALAARRTRPAATLFGGLLLSHLLFSILVHKAVFLGADMMMPLLTSVVLLALGLSLLPGRWQIPATAALLGWAAFLVVRNYPFVVGLTRDPAGVEYIERVEGLEAPPGAVVMAPWGWRYFALSYAHRVEGRMSQWDIVDHRATFAELAPATTGSIYTAADTLFLFGPDWWAQLLGSPLRITSAGPGMVALSGPGTGLAPAQGDDVGAGLVPAHMIGDGIALVGWEVRPADAVGRTDIVLYWAAMRTPSADYSTFVHATDQEAIASPGDLLAGNDYASPVYGWYPTTRWQTGEVVREDHVLDIPPDRPVRTIFAGMYSRDAAGNFIPLGQIALRRVGEEWLAEP